MSIPFPFLFPTFFALLSYSTFALTAVYNHSANPVATLWTNVEAYQTTTNMKAPPGLVLRGYRKGHATNPVRGQPPNEIFRECNWTLQWKFSDYMLVLCPKLHI